MDKNDAQDVEQNRNTPTYRGSLLASMLMILKAPKAGIFSNYYFLFDMYFYYHVSTFIAFLSIAISRYILGGRTIWPRAGVTVAANTGDGVFWYNLFRNEKADYTTQHQGCGVISGSKWIGNKLIGYNNQWNTINCGLSNDKKFDLFG